MPNVYISGVKKCDFVQNLASFYFMLKKTQPESIDELVDNVPIRIHFVN